MTVGDWPLSRKTKSLNATISRFSISGESSDDSSEVSMLLPESIEPMISRVRYFQITTTTGMTRIKSGCDLFENMRKQSEIGASELATSWKAMLLDPNAPVNAKALTSTVKPIFQALSWFGAGAVDLRNLPVDSVNGMHLAVILRATYTRKSQTFGWDQALTIARQALTRDGISAADALAGLS